MREELTVEGLPERGLVQGGDRGRRHGARAGAQYQVVDRPGGGEEGVKRLAARRVDLGDVHEVADPLGRLVKPFLGSPGDENVRALGREGLGGRFADPGAGADDHYPLSVE